MKKLLAGALLSALLLSGCGAPPENCEDTVSKAQLIEIRGADGAELLSLADEAEIEEFVSALEIAAWRLTGLPEDAEALWTAELYQESTIKLGRTEPGGRDLLMRLEAYRGGVIGVELLSSTLVFEVTESAAEYMEGLAD